MKKVTSVTPLDGFRLEVVFDDGLQGIVSLHDRLFGPVFEPLLAESAFRQAYVDEFGVICWPTGADLAPDALYDRIARVVNVESVR